ncbi:flavodoxin family protein [Rhizobium sp. NFR03]|uniref:flavodoxin family protein n=1 Tax=Rhizobium sp. NFR03 TaxID=1566263 RepID=UPI0008CA07C4|nr:flavodoxin family protein [Rhizobium sp. NFR03]SER66569.1 Multimeric flavodoxin WrbA [Rhizobium sp. NFR03]
MSYTEPRLKALALNATLKPSTSDTPSSTERLLSLISASFSKLNVQTEIVRLSEHNILPGVTSDEGEGDDWPAIRQKLLAADILILGTPIWLGQLSSIAKRALERMDAFLDEMDGEGRMVSYGRVATVAVVGNEDGAHNVSAQAFQALNDLGFTLPANAVAYWVGEAMGSTNFSDLEEIPEAVTNAIDMMTRNAAHLAGLLQGNNYPGEEET